MDRSQPIRDETAGFVEAARGVQTTDARAKLGQECVIPSVERQLIDLARSLPPFPLRRPEFEAGERLMSLAPFQ